MSGVRDHVTAARKFPFCACVSVDKYGQPYTEWILVKFYIHDPALQTKVCHKTFFPCEYHL